MLKKELGLLILILVIGSITAAINPQFISQINLMNLANQIGLFGLISIGAGLVIISGGVDLSVGSMFALLGIVFLDLLVNYELAWPVALLLTIAGGSVLGLIHGLLVTRLKMQPFVVTLCGLLLYRGIARWYTADSTQGFGYGYGYETLEWLMSGRTYNIPHTFIFLLIVATLMGVVLHRSVYGRYLFAVGKSEEAARFSGIPTIISTTPDSRLIWGYLPDQTGMLANQIKLAADASAATDAYKGNSLVVHNSNGRFALSIVAYNGATKVATLGSNKPINPALNNYYHVVPDGKIAMTSADVQAAIMDYQVDGMKFSDHMKLVAATLYGQMAIDPDGVTVRFRDIQNTKARVTSVTTTDGQRTSVSRDVT